MELTCNHDGSPKSHTHICGFNLYYYCCYYAWNFFVVAVVMFMFCAVKLKPKC